MDFGKGSTDGQSHSEAPWFRCVEGTKYPIHLIDDNADSAIADGDAQRLISIPGRFNAELTWSIRDLTQRFDAVQDRIQDDLLQLYAVIC